MLIGNIYNLEYSEKLIDVGISNAIFSELKRTCFFMISTDAICRVILISDGKVYYNFEKSKFESKNSALEKYINDYIAEIFYKKLINEGIQGLYMITENDINTDYELFYKIKRLIEDESPQK
ncbi:MAG: hypothetical protein QXV75_07180 [Candidatus Bathyarchaeia archaeon]